MSTLTIQKWPLYRTIRLLTVIFFIIFLVSAFLRWALLSNGRTQLGSYGRDNAYLPRMNFLENAQDGEGVQAIKYARPDLAKYVHLDLKGAPPKAEKFFESFFAFLKALHMGIKGVVIEYEDTLPLQGNLADITHRRGYSRSDIKLIEDSAKKHGLEIIPLIQTFGHLEWILKLDEFQSYRDHPKLPTVISPCHNGTYALLEDLLQQTLDMHPNSSSIHIGCDEVTVTNANALCEGRSNSPSETYIQHLRRVIDIVRKIRPGMRILVWDDILRADQFVRGKTLLKQIEGQIEPVSWNYFPTFDDYYKNLKGWRLYPKYFKSIWAASAFKGGLHRFSVATDTAHHVSNNREWLHFIESSPARHNSISAIILTGWSRFDHFMPLCDLLPTAYPSLLYSLHALNTDDYLTGNVAQTCDALLKSIGKDGQLCDLLPGISIWQSISSLKSLLAKIQRQLKIIDTIVPEYNRKHLFGRRFELESRLGELNGFSKALAKSKETIDRHLSDLYSADVVEEWLDLYISPIQQRINTTFVELRVVQEKIVWQRRPLTS